MLITHPASVGAPEISYGPPAADNSDEYHDLEIQLAKPGLTARTLKGYYAQPASSTGAISRTLTLD
jgi:hypothetical protein